MDPLWIIIGFALSFSSTVLPLKYCKKRVNDRITYFGQYRDDQVFDWGKKSINTL